MCVGVSNVGALSDRWQAQFEGFNEEEEEKEVFLFLVVCLFHLSLSSLTSSSKKHKHEDEYVGELFGDDAEAFQRDVEKKSKKKKKKKSKRREREEEEEEDKKKGEEEEEVKEEELYLTESEKRYRKRQLETERRAIRELRSLSHRDRVNQFNEKLEQLPEHNDIPRVSAAGNG